MSTASSATSPLPYNASTPPQVSSFIYQNRDDSFASYLAVVRDNLASDPTISRQPPRRISLTRKLASVNRGSVDDDAEIDIFAAEKYFSITSDSQQPDAKTTKPSLIPVDRQLPKTAVTTLAKSRSMTWTVTGSSCASSDTSRNSQGSLFRDRRRAFHLGALGFWCSSCSRKHAVNVNNASCATSSIGQNSVLVEQKQNASWSPASWRIEMTSPGPWPWSGSMDRASSTLLRPRAPPPLPVPPPNVSTNEEDARSESSSELFEIESVALSRAEGAGYEPSEASIAWSVVTASAANMSVVSDRIVDNTGRIGGQGRVGGQGRRRTGILLSGCSSHKAVEVVEQRAAGDRYEKGGLSVAEMESSISPVVARYHVELEAGSGSGRIVAGRANGASWHGGSGRIIL